jgi:hypothetical protein
MNAELCHIQNEIIHKYALGNRIEVGILLRLKNVTSVFFI